MTDIFTQLESGLHRRYQQRKQEAEALATSPESVDALLAQIYDQDEAIRYAAAQVLVLLPETTLHYRAVQKAIITASNREDSARIHSVLLSKIGEFASRSNDAIAGEAQEALYAAAQKDAHIACRRVAIANLSCVAEDAIASTVAFLQDILASGAPSYADEVEVSLANLQRALKRIRPPKKAVWKPVLLQGVFGRSAAKTSEETDELSLQADSRTVLWDDEQEEIAHCIVQQADGRIWWESVTRLPNHQGVQLQITLLTQHRADETRKKFSFKLKLERTGSEQWGDRRELSSSEIGEIVEPPKIVLRKQVLP